jgi:O-antigen/teichoic acid export membrane protein
MGKQQISRNARMAIAQVAFSSVILFVLYRFLLSTIGIEQIGVWSLVLATTSLSRISELGLSGSVVKFVAKYIARGDMDKASGVIQTVAISVGILIGSMLIIAYPLLMWILERVVPAHGLKDALSILPYALASLWSTAIAGVFQSGLDGCQRIDLRGLIMMGGSALNLTFAVVLVPYFGLLGLAYGQIIQAAIIVMISWILLSRELPTLPTIPHRWHKTLFSEMLRYGVNFQIASILNILADPITKAYMSKFGNLSMVAYYEMAKRLIMQLRALLLSANQVVVPVISGLQEAEPERIQNVYKVSWHLLIYLALPLYAGILATIPIISEVWIGCYEKVFVVFAILYSSFECRLGVYTG